MNYLTPTGQSAARRKLTFEEQHIWDLPEDPFSAERDRLAPQRPEFGAAGFEDAMRCVRELEEHLDELTAALPVRFSLPQPHSGAAGVRRRNAAARPLRPLPRASRCRDLTAVLPAAYCGCAAVAAVEANLIAVRMCPLSDVRLKASCCW